MKKYEQMEWKALTVWAKKAELIFAEEQLKSHRAKEGIDYKWERQGNLWAIYVLTDPRVYKE